jgi:amidase
VIEFVCPFRVGVDRPGATGGELSGVSLAVKDVIDVAGVPTGGGNPDFLSEASPATSDADAVAALSAAGATIVGKAITDELAFSLSGTNVHYGTPLNSAAPGHVPGGSSSGSASAVAGGEADIALGTDTAGSVRVPSSYCGVFGLRPTHGRVSLRGALPLAPSFDTCGLFASDGELLERAGRLLLGSGSDARGEAPVRFVLGTDLLAEADPGVAEAVSAAAERLAGGLGVPIERVDVASGRLGDWFQAFRARQLVEVWREWGPWISSRHPSFGPGVAARFEAASSARAEDAVSADAARDEVRGILDRVLPPGGALVLPTAATVAPLPDLDADTKEDLRGRTMRLTCIAGLAGAPAVSLPVPTVDGLPVGLCLVARPGEDETLLAAARLASDAAA